MRNESRRTRRSVRPRFLKWIGAVDRLFGWLVQEEQIEKNPADGIRSQQEADEAANTKRLPFKPDQSAAGVISEAWSASVGAFAGIRT